jgi:FO synthase
MSALDASLRSLLDAALAGERAGTPEALDLLERAPAAVLMPTAERLTLRGFGESVTYSRKVFIPLTELCRDVCHYCTFAKAPRQVRAPFLSEEEVLRIAETGRTAGCKEALFTLGDKPEQRYRSAATALASMGMQTTVDYLQHVAGRVLEHTGLLPHLNAGVMSSAQLRRLRTVSVSMGLMLESAARRLCARGGPHFGSPDKQPGARLAMLEAAGDLDIAMTSGLLIGIGESRRERLEALLALRDLNDRHGHVQELIIQNFRAKPATKMARSPEPTLEEHLWTIAAARLLFGPAMSLQAPPNLRPEALSALIRAGVNDWGGVSPVTSDLVNPEAPWPQLRVLARSTAEAGRDLLERLALVPAMAREPERWTEGSVTARVRRLSDSLGLARPDLWYSGASAPLPLRAPPRRAGHSAALAGILSAVRSGHDLKEEDLQRLCSARGRDLDALIESADALRAEAVGPTVTYVVNRNINYTNICAYHCGFCAFSKGRSHADLRGAAYDMSLEEIARRTVEAAAVGATEVCLQGGIHPRFTGSTYIEIVRAVKETVPAMHVHAFSPLEIRHGADTLGLSVGSYLERLQRAGLSTLPGTAAEVLDDEVRAIICPDKLSTQDWLQVIETAHAVGLRTTATIMYGHVDAPRHWARHLLRLRRLQARTGGITEFVPLGYVHMESPLWRKGRTRSGPTWDESLLMHAVARLALHPLVTNVQASWVKLGAGGAARALQAGANDLGGTLMNESITRAAGGVHGQLLDAAQLQALAESIGRPARQRTTLYGEITRPPDGGPAVTILARSSPMVLAS